MLVREQTLLPAQVQEYVRTNMGKTTFTGIDPGTEPGTEIRGQLNTAKGNLTTEPAIPAQVVRALPPETGNVALIKLARGSLPVAELNPSATLADGSSLLILGFGTADDDFRTATYRPRSKLAGIDRHRSAGIGVDLPNQPGSRHQLPRWHSPGPERSGSWDDRPGSGSPRPGKSGDCAVVDAECVDRRGRNGKQAR